MGLSRIPGDVKQLIHEHTRLLQQLHQMSQEADAMKGQIIDFVNDKELSPKVAISPDDRSIYSETLVSMLVQYQALQHMCEACERLYARKKSELENAAKSIKAAGDGLKWIFTSKAKKQAALEAYQSLEDALRGDYGQLVSQFSTKIESIKNTSADINWRVFCNHPEDIFHTLDLLCPGVRQPYSASYSLRAREITSPRFVFEPIAELHSSSGDNGSSTPVMYEPPASIPTNNAFSSSVVEPAREHMASDAPISANTYEVIRLPVLNSAHAVCPFCGQIMTTRAHVKYPSYKRDGQTTKKYAVLWECDHCKAVYADNRQLSELVEWNKGSTFKTVYPVEYPNAEKFMAAACGKQSLPLLTENDMPYRAWGKHKDNLSESNRVIQVYANKCQCRKCQKKFQVDTVVNRTAVVETVAGGTVNINVMFCRGCGQYFVSLVTLKHHKKLYDGLLMECRTDSDIDASNFSWFNFAADTVLSRCGYTVKEGVSQEYRHAVLSYLLDSGKTSKGEIIENISNSVRLRKNQLRYQGACNRWEEDIKFVSDYKIDSQRFVYGMKLKVHG